MTKAVLYDSYSMASSFDPPAHSKYNKCKYVISYDHAIGKEYTRLLQARGMAAGTVSYLGPRQNVKTACSVYAHDKNCSRC